MTIVRYAVAVLRASGVVELLPSLYVSPDRAELNREWAESHYLGTRCVIVELTGTLPTTAAVAPAEDALFDNSTIRGGHGR